MQIKTSYWMINRETNGNRRFYLGSYVLPVDAIKSGAGPEPNVGMNG